MTGYLFVVGDSWAVAHPWRQAFPAEPFLGVRFDGRATWVLFEPKSADRPVPPSTLREIRRAFEEAGDGWIDENVFFMKRRPSARVTAWPGGWCVFSAPTPLREPGGEIRSGSVSWTPLRILMS